MSEEKVQVKEATPTYIVYDPAKRRRRYTPVRTRRIVYDPAVRRRSSEKEFVDAAIDGLGFGLLFHHLPFPQQQISGFSMADIAAGITTAAYEKMYLKRTLTAAIVGGLVGVAVGKISQALGGWRT